MALSLFLGGLNQEKAKQWPLAVASFQGALKMASDLIAPTLIGAHLEAIRKEHPQDFETGVQLMLADALNAPPLFDPNTKLRVSAGEPSGVTQSGPMG